MSGEFDNATSQPPITDGLGEQTPTVTGDDDAGIETQLYNIVAEVALSGPDLLLSPTLLSCPDVTVRTENTSETTPRHLFISAYGESFDEFERALRHDHTVADPVLVDRYDSRRVYRVQPVADVNLVAPCFPDLDARIIDVESGDGGWIVRMQIPTRSTLVSFREYCLEHDITFKVNQLGNASEQDDDDVVGLTEKQKRLLEMAYECGYYEIPRRISQNELARKLDISTSAISQRLRRDTEQLIGSTLAVEKNDP